MDNTWTEFRMLELLQKRYPKGQYALFSKVHNTTGADWKRAADAIAMGLWPSRGLKIHGFEIKVSRGDWLRELKNPKKAEEVAKYCDYWWLVISDPDYVKDGELPENWGMLVPKGGKLKMARKAQELNPVQIDRRFVASVLRRAHEQTEQKLRNYIPKDEIQHEIDKAFKRGKKAGSAVNTEETIWKGKYERLKRSTNKFELVSGVKIKKYNGDRIGNAVRYVMTAQSAEFAVKQAERTIERGRKEFVEIKKRLSKLQDGLNDGWDD